MPCAPSSGSPRPRICATSRRELVSQVVGDELKGRLNMDIRVTRRPWKTRPFMALAIFCCGLSALALEFRTPEGVAGRADDLGGGVWRVRLADAEGRFSERGAVQALAAFMGEEVPSFGAPDGSRVEVSQTPFAIRFYSRSGKLVREITSLVAARATGTTDVPSVASRGDVRPPVEGFVVKGTLPAGEGVYGFGERLDQLNQRGQKILLCSSDGWNKSDKIGRAHV